MHHRRDCLRICKHRFSLLSSHLSLSRLWQRLFFSRRLEILFIWLIFINFSYNTVEIHFSECRTTTCDMIRFVAVVTDECIYLFWCEILTHFTIIWILIICIQFRCLRSRSRFARLLATRFLIIEVFFEIRFFIFFSDVSEFSIHVSQCLIDELTKTCEFVQIDDFINVRC